MKEWYANLQSREQLIVISCAALLVLFILYLSIWQPVNDKLALTRDKVSSYQISLAWMQAASQQISGMLNQNPNRDMTDSRSLLAVVDSGITKADLKSAVQRMEPDGNQNVKLWLTGGSFNDLIKMLGELEENNGILIKSINLSPTETIGVVDARLTLSTQL